MQTKYTIRATDGRYLAPITIEEAEELERSSIIRPDGEGGYIMVADSAFAVSQYVMYCCQDLCDDLFEEAGPVVIERTASQRATVQQRHA